jgi:hypothetical protein
LQAAKLWKWKFDFLDRSTTAAQECVIPAVKIDNIHDPFATVVTVDMGDQISEMLETVGHATLSDLHIARLNLFYPFFST